MNTNQNHNGKSNDFPEAPASWNTRYVDPAGFECQITLRGESGSELLEKVANAIRYLIENGCTPYTYYRNNNSRQSAIKPEAERKDDSQSNEDHTDDPSWCPIHQCEMKRWEKNGREWYSHQVDGKWCNGKQA